MILRYTSAIDSWATAQQATTANMKAKMDSPFFFKNEFAKL